VNLQTIWALREVAFKLGIFANERRTYTVNAYLSRSKHLFEEQTFSSNSEMQ
jgi:hypothetical protein